MDADDRAILSRWRAHKDEAGASLVEKYGEDVFRWCWMFTRNGDSAEDLAQVAWIRILASLQQFKGDDSSLRTWLFRVVLNLHLNEERGNSRRSNREDKFIRLYGVFGTEIDPTTDQTAPVHVEPSVGPVEIAERNDELDLLKKALESLGEQCRSILELSYWFDFTVEEIAEILECSKRTVASKKRACLNQLKKKLQSAQDGGV